MSVPRLLTQILLQPMKLEVVYINFERNPSVASRRRFYFGLRCDWPLVFSQNLPFQELDSFCYICSASFINGLM